MPQRIPSLTNIYTNGMTSSNIVQSTASKFCISCINEKQ